MVTDFAAVANDTLERWRDARRAVLQRKAGASSIHAWRISTRRLFALEQLLAPSTRRRRLLDALHPAFRSTGKLRDTQIAIRLLSRETERFPAAEALVKHLRRDVPRLRRRTTRHLRALRTRYLREIVDGWCKPQRGTFELLAQRRASSRLMALRAQSPNAPLRTAASVHRQRLRLKSLRYMIELCRGANCPLPHEDRVPQRLARLQSLLGDITDLQVIVAMIDRRGRRHPHWKLKAAELRGDLLRRRQQLLDRLS